MINPKHLTDKELLRLARDPGLCYERPLSDALVQEILFRYWCEPCRVVTWFTRNDLCVAYGYLYGYQQMFDNTLYFNFVVSGPRWFDRIIVRFNADTEKYEQKYAYCGERIVE